MQGKPYSGTAEAVAKSKPLEPAEWHKILEVFSEIARINLHYYDSTRSSFTSIKKVTPYCSDISTALDLSRTEQRPFCGELAVQSWRGRKENSFRCIHHLYFHSVETSFAGAKGFLVAGPVLLGKREPEEDYRKLCMSLHIDPEVFMDGLREIHSFSHGGIKLVLEFLHGSSELARGAEKAADMRSGEESRRSEDSELAMERAADRLFDFVGELAGPDSSSIMLFDPVKSQWFVAFSRGLDPEFSRKPVSMEEGGIASWVYARRRAVWLRKDTGESELKSKMKRPEITSSMVVPLEHDGEHIGVLCVNSVTENSRFNAENFALLEQLGKLASPLFSP